MIGAVLRAIDNLTGRGDAAVTVPALDGALRPNRRLDEARTRWPLPGVDAIAVLFGSPVASAGTTLYRLADGTAWQPWRKFDGRIACIAAIGDEGLAVVLETGDILIEGGSSEGRSYRVPEGLRCITAIATSPTAIFLANGSATNPAPDWQLDLMQRNASGSLWRIDRDSGKGRRLADGLAWPAGLALDGNSLVFSEAWKHRLARLPLTGGEPVAVHSDLPGYPGRLAPAEDGGAWLAIFAPRSQLVEFVLRERAYKTRMIAEVPRPFWIAPSLRSGRSFYEPLQGGSVKQLGLLKPWAPALSAGLCVRLDRGFQPTASLHSRADGDTHGVTDMAEHQGRVFIAASGDGVVVACDAGTGEEGSLR
ncbi:hypothetical protein LL06_02165 [Hoeflea sp. BAL378]|uniref:hypothetical protein n=1 Tax=Hoeflea sp. BAL378 TaxID=1547437 RepID=UPI00051451EA|nr:hypothetical protein [Hoeflea sp. BAL378]KGF70907.1 hypothetical protein LL06_02165 [Hoeflea sp. BAL378]